jgi:hypothetical protein
MSLIRLAFQQQFKMVSSLKDVFKVAGDSKPKENSEKPST